MGELKMGFNRSPLAFDDVRELFERALASPKGIRVVCVSRSEAIVRRGRFNYFRKLNRRESMDVYERGHPMHGKSPYDRLVLRVPPKGAKDEHVLYVEPRSTEDFLVEEIK
jgi:hypothetical protein